MTEYVPAETEEYLRIFPNLQNSTQCEKDLKQPFGVKILFLDIICSSELIVFLELHSRKTVRVSEQNMSADKYPSIFSRQMATNVYII